MPLFLGVDGGNTKTIALCAQADGTIVGVGRSGCGDMYNAGEDAALAAIEEAIDGALHVAGAEKCEVVAGGFSLAGADWPEDYEFLERALLARGLARRVVVVNDGLGALRAGSPDGTGVAVVCGTGLAVGARAPSGRWWHGSFWLESRGSGSLARAALHAVSRAELGIGPATSLTDRVMELFHQSSVEDVIHLVTARGHQPVKMGGLAQVLLDEAEAGDRVARTIALQHGEDMGAYAAVAAQKVGIEAERFTLVLAGGVLRHPSPLLSDTIVERVRRSAPLVRCRSTPFEPVVGALFLGLEHAGIPIDEITLHNVERTVPPSAVFATLP